MKKLLFICLLLLSGCITKQGYIGFGVIDGRTEEQIIAGIRESEAPYRCWEYTDNISIKDEPVVKPKVAVPWWKAILSVIKIDSRIAIFEMRWKSNDE